MWPTTSGHKYKVGLNILLPSKRPLIFAIGLVYACNATGDFSDRKLKNSRSNYSFVKIVHMITDGMIHTASMQRIVVCFVEFFGVWVGKNLKNT